MLNAGTRYTQEFLGGAKQQLRRMQQYFLVPDLELEPQVYLHVTTNWVGLTMRYVVDPKKRRTAATYLYRAIFDEVIKREDIEIGTDTMEITYKQAAQSEAERQKQAAVQQRSGPQGGKLPPDQTKEDEQAA
jgi:hypothetical protein